MPVPWKVPVMQAPIGPATTADLVSAVSGTGALGTLAASWTEPDVLRRQLQRVRAAVGIDYCVNLVLAFDQRERLDVILDEGVRFVSFSWGIDGELIGRAHDRGAVVLVQVDDVAGAVEASERGADVVIAQGVEAGGHVQGTTRLVELLLEMRSAVELPIVAAGGISDSASVRAAVFAGADAVACGTAFLAAREADVHPVYLARLFHAVAADTVLTTVFDLGWPDAPHRVIRNATYATWDSAGRLPRGARMGEGDVVGTRDGTPIVRYSDAQPTRGTAGDIDAMALYAGMSVGQSAEARAPTRSRRGLRALSGSRSPRRPSYATGRHSRAMTAAERAASRPRREGSSKDQAPAKRPAIGRGRTRRRPDEISLSTTCHLAPRVGRSESGSLRHSRSRLERHVASPAAR